MGHNPLNFEHKTRPEQCPDGFLRSDGSGKPVRLWLGGHVEFRSFGQNGCIREIQSVEVIETVGVGAVCGGKVTVSHLTLDGDGADLLLGVGGGDCLLLRGIRGRGFRRFGG